MTIYKLKGITLEDLEGGITVSCGGLSADCLTRDEALWTIAQLLAGRECAYLKSKEEIAAWEARLAELQKR